MKNKTVLIIEGDRKSRENVADLLALNGYDVLMASNGKEGVEAALKLHPDLILCDIDMPILDGQGVLHLLDKNIQTSRIPIIIMIDKLKQNDFYLGVKLSSDEYVVKPYKSADLIKKIDLRIKKVDENVGTIDHLNFRLSQVKDKEIFWDEKFNDVPDRQTRSIGKRQLIYSEGDNCDGVYVVLKGKVKVFKSHDLGKDLILRVRGKGEMIAYVSLLQGDIHLDNAEALEPSEIMFIPRHAFNDWLQHQPKMMLELIQLMSSALVFERERAVTLAYSSVRRRTASALLRLKMKFHEANPDVLFTMPISRDDLAAMVGTATESVIRTLSDFKEEGLIKIQGSAITIVHEEKLRRMKN